MVNYIKRFCIIMIAVALGCCMPNRKLISYAAEETEETPEISGEIEVILNRSEEAMEKYIEAFERKYPNVTVKYTKYSNYEAGIKERMNEGDYGDVLFIPDFVSASDYPYYFESLGNKVALSAKYDYIDYGKYQNYSVYGIPSAAYLVGIVYNKEVFDKAGITDLPTTMDEFLYAMYLIDEHTEAIPFYTGYQESWMLQYWENFQFIEMTGDPSYRYGEFITVVNPFREGTVHYRALRFLYDLVENGYTEQDRQSIDWAQSQKMLNNGELACTAVGTWAFYDYKNAGEHGDNVGFMPFPNSVNGEQYATLNVDYNYGVSKNSDNKEAAKAFIFFMLDESGYAFDHDTISILKSDPYPECYNGMTQTTMRNSVATVNTYYNQFVKLSTNLDLGDTSEYARIIDAASGKSEESFDEIMEDWNARWEASRDANMVTEIKKQNESIPEDILTVDNRNVELSANELQYISDNPVLRVGYHKNMSPLSFEVDGEFTGAAFEVCELIGQETGLRMEYYGYENTQALDAALQAGEIDIIAGIEKSDENLNVRYSKEYLNYMDVVVRHSTVDVISQKKAAVVIGEQSKSNDPQQEVSYATIGECMEKVQNMDVDYTITNYYSANYYMRERNCTDVTILPYTVDKTYHIGFSMETDPTLIAICNKCLYSIQDGEMLISLMDYMDAVVKNVTLQTFISANPILSLSIIVSVLLIVFGAILWIMYERGKSSRKQALDAQKYERLASLADEYFFEYELTKKQLLFDAKFREASGFEQVVKKEDFVGKNEVMLPFFEQIENSLEQKKNLQFTVSLDNKDGTKQWYRAVTSIIFDKRQQPVHLIGKLVSIQKEMEEVANYQNKAHRDALTKLYNREGFRIHLPQEAKDVTFAIMDMDNFKMVNDTLGHDGGDYALNYLARTLEDTMGEEAVIGRYGGDEFVVAMTRVSAEEAGRRFEKLVRAMNVELHFEGNTREISISVGAVHTPEMKPFEELLHQADEVLYKTKAEGKNNFKLVVK